MRINDTHAGLTGSLFAAAFLLSASLPAAAQEVTAANNPMTVNPSEYLDRINLPEGFSISIYADGMEEPRSMAVGEDGTVYVGTFGGFGGEAVGKVYAVTNRDGAERADEVLTIAEGLNYPNGVALKDGHLYVAEIGRILRYDNIADNLRNPPEPVVVSDALPDDFHHGWKYIAFGPDGKLYVPVGAPCNICEVEDPYATIMRMNDDGSELEVFARGVRNTVGFDWHPETTEMWFTDNGRDLWGNNRPPEELNHAPREGMHFGFPHRYGVDLVDEEFPTDMADHEFTPAAVEFPAHNAGLGMNFYTGTTFPPEYKHQLFIAYHGSWNRNPPDGYKVRLVLFENGVATGFQDFATGWLIDEQYWGRPVDVANLPDGSILVSDDHAGVIYRIAYGD